MNKKEYNIKFIQFEENDIKKYYIKINSKLSDSRKIEDILIPLNEEIKDLYELNIYLFNYIKRLKHQYGKRTLKRDLIKIDISRPSYINKN